MQEQINRPMVVTILCIWTAISVVFSIVGFLTPSSRAAVLPQGLLSRDGLIFIISTFTLVTMIVGYWVMKTWGVYAYVIHLIFKLMAKLIGVTSMPTPYITQDKNLIFISMLYTIAPLVFLGVGYYYIIRPRYLKKKIT